MEFSIKQNLINGMFVPPLVTQETVDSFIDFTPNPDDVIIASYPKSGTNWILQIAKLVLNGGEEDNIGFFEYWMEAVGKKKCEATPSTRCLHTHMSYDMVPGGPPAQSPAKYIYLVRNPKDVAVSYYHFQRSLKLSDYHGDWNDFFEKFCKGEVTYNLWFDHILSWWKHKDADNILFLKYEDMKKDHLGAVTKIAKFIGREFPAEKLQKITEMSTFDYMKNSPVAQDRTWKMILEEGYHLFRKGVVGDWKSHFSQEQISRLDALYESKMAGTGLDFTN